MPSQLHKVQKHITKKKQKPAHALTTLHANSRDAQRLRRATARDSRVAHTTSTRQKANQPWLERVAFFRDRLPETLHPLELPGIQAIIAAFLGRHADELARLRAERRAGRPPANRAVLLERAGAAEEKEYEGGLWVPDVRDEGTLMALDGWDGEWLGLANMRFVRVAKDGAVVESQFPPRGAS